MHVVCSCTLSCIHRSVVMHVVCSCTLSCIHRSVFMHVVCSCTLSWMCTLVGGLDSVWSYLSWLFSTLLIDRDLLFKVMYSQQPTK